MDAEIEAYFARVIEETEKVDKNITQAVKYAQKIIMSGGKRARAAFMYYGYLAVGGKERKKMIKASVSIELIHAFLLMHDDIIDQDGFRHGIATIHEHYRKIAQKYFKNKNAEHFGNSMALIIGDMIGALGNQVIFESKFEPKLIMKALHRLQGVISFTVVGESEDVLIENRGKATEKEIMRMYENKTAKYTIEGPLHLGAILGGADEKFLEALSFYAIPVGIAFQIQDDILGAFGNSAKLGKEVGSDIKQGKQTILVAKALQKADSKQKAVIKNCLGNKNLSQKDLKKFRQAIIETGSLDYAKNLARELVTKGKKKIEEANINLEAKKFMLGIADYMVNREV